MGILPFPICILFQIHGRKSKLHPVRNLSQACVSGISQTVLLFGICKDALYGFFSCLVHPLVNRSVSGIISHLLVFLPDVPSNGFNAIFVLCAKMSGGTVGTYFRVAFIFSISISVGCAVVQHLVFRADNTVEMLVIYIFPPFMSALCLGTLIGCG